MVTSPKIMNAYSELSPSKKTITTMRNIKVMARSKYLKEKSKSRKSLEKWKGKFSINDPE